MRRFNTRVLFVGAAGIAAGALLVPGIVGANARRGTGGNQAAQAGLERTFTAVLKGSNETTGGDPDGAGALHMLPSPLRAYDSRTGTAPTKIGARETRTVNLWFGLDGANVSQLAVPPGATGALVTLTATETVGAGYLTLYSADLTAVPATSTLNWSTVDSDIATSATVAVSKTSDVKVTAGPQATHFVIDVVGYYF